MVKEFKVMLSQQLELHDKSYAEVIEIEVTSIYTLYRLGIYSDDPHHIVVRAQDLPRLVSKAQLREIEVK